MARLVPLTPNALPESVMDSRLTPHLASVETFSVMAPVVDEIWNAIQVYASREPAPEARKQTDRPAPAHRIVFLEIVPTVLVAQRL